MESIFDESEVAVINGGVDTATALLQKRFDHIFFTGSPKVGKIVMKAAAEHLTSVTLELGGKSPTIIDQSANLKVAAKRITAGKFTNNSQTCVAHDYIFVHRSKTEELIALLKQNIIKFYGEDASESESYCRIINKANTGRLADIIQEVKLWKPESIVYGGDSNLEDHYISPTLILNPDLGLRLMKEEIFGPIMPILEYDELDEVISYINQGEKPLALYIFSSKASNIRKVRNLTSSGSMNINETAIHYYHNNLPFGGTNNSGFGKAHGFFGFKSFSNEKGILRQNLLKSPIELIYPPYTKMSKFWVDLFMKYF
jgi:aldehyde dehydrogenase (NAD+)